MENGATTSDAYGAIDAVQHGDERCINRGKSWASKTRPAPHPKYSKRPAAARSLGACHHYCHHAPFE